MAERITLAEQAAELRREAAMRKAVYPTFISRGKLTEAEAEKHQARLSAAIDTLEWLARNESAVRAKIGEKPAHA